MIIGAGLHRTGTTTLAKALSILGIEPVYDMFTLAGRPGDLASWREARDGDFRGIRRCLSPYEALLDWPGCGLCLPFADVYPKARVILTVRDSGQWFESHAALFRGMFQAARLGNVDHGQGALVGEWIIGDTFRGKVFDRDFCESVFRRHNETVVNSISSRRLLRYDVIDGWRPLCDFLELDVPDLVFPHENSRESVFRNTFEATRRGRT